MQPNPIALGGDEAHEKKGYGQGKGNTGHGADQEFFRETAFFKFLETGYTLRGQDKRDLSYVPVDDQDRHDESLQKPDQIPTLVGGLGLAVLGLKASEQTADQNGGGLQTQKDDQGIDNILVKKRGTVEGGPPRGGGTEAQASKVGDQDDSDVNQLIYAEAVQMGARGVQVTVGDDLEPINGEMGKGDDRHR